jgi:O-antigen/teichoic acid export membrane protein
VNTLEQKPKSLQERIVSGSVVLLSGSGLTIAISLAYNIAIAQFLGPQGFGHATAVYTLLTLLSALTLSFQLVSTKVVAQQGSREGKAAAYVAFYRAAWVCGLLVAALLLAFQGAITDYLNLPGRDLVALLAIGAAFYVPLGSRRGYIQGTFGFRRLAFNLVLEGAARLGGSLLMIAMGYGVRGVVAANSAAIAVAYFGGASRLAPRSSNPIRFSYAVREMSQALVFFSGQVLINNCDIVLVKHFFSAQPAGLYAAVAMVGRVIFSFSSAVVNTTFPLVAGTRDEERRDLRVIATSLMLVIGAGSVIALGLCVAPPWIWKSLFGPGFESTGRYSVSYLLALYAITTVVYSLSTVIITFEMSYKIANTSLIQLVFSGVVIAGICRFHSSLREVILVQLILLTGLVVFVAFPFLLDTLPHARAGLRTGSCRALRLIRSVPEDEVIAEFLKSDFYCPEYREYQDSMHSVVFSPDLSDSTENAKRRALLFIRHLSLWKEVPQGTMWHEVEINERALGEIRVFPRAHWRRLARGNFSITQVVENIRKRRDTLDAPFLEKIGGIGDRFSRDGQDMGAAILIGMNEDEPFTVLDGNHRLVAALLASPRRLDKLRFFCGFSPRMTGCCWYNTNLTTLFRYGVNVVTQAIRSPETEFARVLRSPEDSDAVVEA